MNPIFVFVLFSSARFMKWTSVVLKTDVCHPNVYGFDKYSFEALWNDSYHKEYLWKFFINNWGQYQWTEDGQFHNTRCNYMVINFIKVQKLTSQNWKTKEYPFFGLRERLVGCKKENLLMPVTQKGSSCAFWQETGDCMILHSCRSHTVSKQRFCILKSSRWIASLSNSTREG